MLALTDKDKKFWTLLWVIAAMHFNILIIYIYGICVCVCVCLLTSEIKYTYRKTHHYSIDQWIIIKWTYLSNHHLRKQTNQEPRKKGASGAQSVQCGTFGLAQVMIWLAVGQHWAPLLSVDSACPSPSPSPSFQTPSNSSLPL